MNINIDTNPEIKKNESINRANEPAQVEEEKDQTVKPPQEVSDKAPVSTEEASLAIDKATQLLQTIVTDKISEEVVRKVPADEYLDLISRLDKIISGSLDDQV